MYNLDSLVKNILKIKTTDHLQIQWQIRKMLQDLGFETKIEEKLLKFFESYGKYKVLVFRYIWENLWKRNDHKKISWFQKLIRL